jgi:hypothetical protein
MSLTILIIRHAEKPGEAWPGSGFTADGAQDDKSLVIRGWQRAGAWAALFSEGRGGASFPRPDTIYAANPNVAVAGDSDPSKRPFETITPLAAKLNKTPVTKWAQGQEDKLAGEITKLTGAVLVCWEHKKIVEALLPKIAGNSGLTLPTHWPSGRFDLVLRFDHAAPDAPWQCQQLFPKLLSGDSDSPI